MDIDFFLEIVIPKILISTIASITVAVVVGGIIGTIIDFARRKKARLADQPPPPRLMPLAILGSFLGTMLIAFLPINIDRNSIIGGPYYAIWLYIQLITLVPTGSILGAVLATWAGTTWRQKYNRQNVMLAIGIVYLVMTIAIYSFLVTPTPQITKNTRNTPVAGNSLPVIAQISGYDSLKNFVKHMAFTPDSRSLAIGSKENIRILDLQSQQITKTFKVTSNTLKDLVNQLVFTPDGKKLITAAPEEIQIRDSQSGEILQRLNAGHVVYPTPDGKRLVGFTTGSTYSNLLVWNLQNYQLLQTIPAQLMPWEDFGSNPVSISPDSKTLIFAPQPHNNLLQVWDLNPGKQIKSLGTNGGKHITAMAISPDSKQLLEVHDKNLYLWDIDQGKIVRTIPQVGIATAVLYRPDGQTIIISTEESIGLWDLKTGKPMKTVDNKNGLARYTSFSPDGKLIAVYQNNLVNIFQLP